jgi:hypothetical protein
MVLIHKLVIFTFPASLPADTLINDQIITQNVHSRCLAQCENDETDKSSLLRVCLRQSKLTPNAVSWFACNNWAPQRIVYLS